MVRLNQRFQSFQRLQWCWTTVEETDSEERDDWRLLAMMLQASAQTGYAQWQMSPADEAALEEQLRLVGLTACPNTVWNPPNPKSKI